MRVESGIDPAGGVDVQAEQHLALDPLLQQSLRIADW